jgi:hypothetical protein
MRKLLWILAGLAAWTLGDAEVRAATTSDAGEATATPATAPQGAAPADAEADPPKPPNPLARYLEPARDLVGQVQMRSDQVQEWLRAARRARYRERSSCLDDLLSQSHAVEREADVAKLAATKAVDQSDAHGVLRELVHLYVYDQRSRTLLEDAQWCGVARRPTSPRLPVGRFPRQGASSVTGGRTGFAEPGARPVNVR